MLGAVLEPLHREFGLSDTQLAVLATAFTLLYAVAGLPLGRLADTWSRKRLLAIGVGVWGALTALGGLASSYGMLLATRLGAVSYTHLDVYKRQMSTRACSSCAAGPGGFRWPPWR